MRLWCSSPSGEQPDLSCSPNTSLPILIAFALLLKDIPALPKAVALLLPRNHFYSVCFWVDQYLLTCSVYIPAALTQEYLQHLRQVVTMIMCMLNHLPL